MPFYEMSEEDFNSIDESVRSKAKPYEPEDVSGLKNKANQLLSEKKDAETKLAEALAESKNLRTQLEKGGKVDPDLAAKLEDSEKRRAEAENLLAEYKTTAKREKLSNAASSIANELTKHTGRAKLLTEKLSNRLDFDDKGELVVLSEDGKPTVSTVDELKASAKRDYDFLVDAPNASGGGAPGGQGGAGSPKTMTRSEFDKLAPGAAAKFFKDGGKLVDD